MRGKRKPTPGAQWVFRRYRRVRRTNKVLAARKCGYQAWRMMIRRPRR